MPNTPAKTAANKKWYELNKTKHNAICYPNGVKYYASHKEHLCEKARIKYHFYKNILNQEFLILRNIDLF